MKRAALVIVSLVLGAIVAFWSYPDVSSWYKLKRLGHL